MGTADADGTLVEVAHPKPLKGRPAVRKQAPRKLWQLRAHSTRSESVVEQVERFTAQDDLKLDEALFRYDVLASLAHAHMLRQIGILRSAELAKLRSALIALVDQQVHLTPADEDVHTKLENLLVARVGKPALKIHTGRSRNDQVLVALRLQMKDRLIALMMALLDLTRALLKLAGTHRDVPMPGYTHTRVAMLSSVGLWAGAHAEGLVDDAEFADTAYALIDRNPLGAAAGYGVPLNLDRDLTARLLGFAQLQNNTLAVMNSRGKLEFCLQAALAAVILDLNRLATDLIHFSSAALGFFEIPPEFCTGSSIMPQKQNPDVLELVRARSASVIAGVTQQAMLVKGLGSGYHRDLQESKRPTIEALGTVGSCLRVLAPLIANLRVKKENLRRALTPDLFATDEVFDLVRAGVPMREAYRRVKEQLTELKPRDPLQALKARSHCGAPGNLGLEELARAIRKQQTRWMERQRHFARAMEALLARA